MIKRIIEISQKSYCSVKLDNFIIEKSGGDRFSIPLEDLGVVVVDNKAITFSQGLLVKMAEENIAVIFCDDSHLPMGILLPLYKHHQHSKIIKAQASISEPLKKNIWAQIIKQKIKMQAECLKLLDKKSAASFLMGLSKKVLSGDISNMEGQAAKKYFKALFGDDFIRRPVLEDHTNPLLNYGYSLVRSLCIRSAVGAGLHPSLGVFHKNQYNPFCLGDDLMEICRPLVDYHIIGLQKQGIYEITPETKPEILALLKRRIYWEGAETSLISGLQKYAFSLNQVILGLKKKLLLPNIF